MRLVHSHVRAPLAPPSFQVGESGGAPYAAACGALLPQRTQQVALLAGLAAVNGREHAKLRNGLQVMDRWGVNWASRVGLAHLLHWLMRLAAYVSAAAGGGRPAWMPLVLRFSHRAARNL